MAKKNTDKTKKLDKEIRVSMLLALDEWRINGAGSLNESFPKSKEKIYEQLCAEIKDDFPGYEISEETVKSHFHKYQPPLFLLVWYANRFGVSVDYLLTGHSNTKISAARNEIEVVNAFILENGNLIRELAERSLILYNKKIESEGGEQNGK